MRRCIRSPSSPEANAARQSVLVECIRGVRYSRTITRIYDGFGAEDAGISGTSRRRYRPCLNTLRKSPAQDANRQARKGRMHVDILHTCPELDLAVPERRALRRHARVLDERAGAKCRTVMLPKSGCCSSNVRRLRRRARVRRESASQLVVVGDARTGERKIGVDCQPRFEAHIVRPLNANAPAGVSPRALRRLPT